MINTHDILETINMIQDENLDIRTITMGISLLDCCTGDAKSTCDKIYEKMTRKAENLVKTGEDIEKEYGIPIINKRISVTPISMILASGKGDPVLYAKTLESLLALRSRPTEHRSLFGPYHFQPLHRFRSLLVDKGELGL